MNVSELFEKIQDNFLPEELNGEFTLQGNCIIWTYNLEHDSEEIEMPNEDDDEIGFSFESQSTEELLNEAYDEDLALLEGLLDELEETDNWSFSEPETNENIISFKIF
jgi:hypothetical protein